MAARRLTSEQQRAVTQLKALAAPYRFRVVVDAESFPIIPGRHGRIERYCDGVKCWSCAFPRRLALAVHTDHPRVFQRLWTIPGVVRHQSGDAEMRAVFAVELLVKVASVIRAKRWADLAAVAPRILHQRPDNRPLPAAQSRGTPRAKGEQRVRPSEPGAGPHDAIRPDQRRRSGCPAWSAPR